MPPATTGIKATDDGYFYIDPAVFHADFAADVSICGFVDQSHFTRVFSKSEGYGPGTMAPPLSALAPPVAASESAVITNGNGRYAYIIRKDSADFTNPTSNKPTAVPITNRIAVLSFGAALGSP